MRSVLFFIGSLLAAWLQGQTQVVSLNVETATLSPNHLLSADLLHDGGAQTIRLQGHITSKRGDRIVQFVSNDILVMPGEAHLPFGRIPMREFSYANTVLGRAARMDHRLPSGSYKVCVIASGGMESLDEFCEDIEVDEQLFLDLTEPWDKDTIDETRPSLFWTLSGTSLPVEAMDLLLVLAPADAGMDAQRSVGSQVPVFRLKQPSYPVVQFPSGAPSLVRGKCYAWQVVLARDGIVRERSDTWSFCIRKDPAVEAHRYILLRETRDATVYQASDDRLFFRFDEPYSVERITCEVLDIKRERVLPSASRVEENGASSNVDARSIGTNLYEFDLRSYDLEDGTYELRVKDGKGRDRSIQFTVHAP